MSIISFASLKGGVGKTSLSLNVAHAFAEQGNRVLLIDSDPSAHVSRFFKSPQIDQAIEDSTLGRLFFSLRTRLREDPDIDLLDAAEEFQIPLVFEVRDNLAVLPGSSQLHHFLWGPGARIYKKLFPQLINELTSLFDLIIFDTCPDFNLLTRNIIAASNLVVVPVDASEMSILSLEQIFKSSSHIKGPSWAIVRSMVSRQASRVRKLSEVRLEDSDILGLKDPAKEFEETEDEEDFLDLVRNVELNGLSPEELIDDPRLVENNKSEDLRDIFLLRSVVHRTEIQNRLSFTGKTAFDNKGSKKLAAEYNGVARELEAVLSLAEQEMETDSGQALSTLVQNSSSEAEEAEEAGY